MSRAYRPRHPVLVLCIAAATVFGAPPGYAADATLVSVSGEVQVSLTKGAAFQPAVTNQVVNAGAVIKTGKLAKAAILLSDGTELRLNQYAVLEVKAIGAAGAATDLALQQGQAYGRSGKRTGGALSIGTPSATAAIRGTEWDLTVAKDGAATLSVLDGEIALANEFGTVSVLANEQATAMVGRPPIKMLLTNPRDRVQWVNAYTVDPMRHIELNGDLGNAGGSEPMAGLRRVFDALKAGDGRAAQQQLDDAALGSQGEFLQLARIAVLIQTDRLGAAADALDTLVATGVEQPAAYLLQSELMIYAGDLAAAIGHAEAGLTRFANDPRLLSHLAKVLVYADRLPASRAQLAKAFAAAPQSTEARLTEGLLALREGDAPGARRSYQSVARTQPSDDRAWFGLGLIDSEREDLRRGRRNLTEATRLQPFGPGYQGELGTLHTKANAFSKADAAFEKARAFNPNDYVTLTGMGVLELKRGNPRAALDLFNKASLLETRYSRAHLYAALAYYQLGKVDDAFDELAIAKQIDPKDPFPHFVGSMIHTDHFEAGKALAESREAMTRLPFLKSLNQLFNDQRGGANLGNSFAFFGLEEWAQSYAQESYTPFWAGSHLFLADRYPGLFNKNSELFQGFLEDPTVFGASNRFQTLLPKPGLFATAGVQTEFDDAFRLVTPFATVNGYSASVRPAAVFIDAARTDINPDGSGRFYPYEGSTERYKGAIGFNPRPDLGVFVFGTRDETDVSFSQYTESDIDSTDESAAIRQTANRFEVGAHWEYSPTSQLWAKFGLGRDKVTDSFADFTADAEVAAGTTNDYGSTSDIDELALRHTATIADRLELTIGAERAKQEIDEAQVLYQDASDDEGDTFVEDDYFETNINESRTAYASGRLTANDKLLVQADLFLQEFEKSFDYYSYAAASCEDGVCDNEDSFADSQTRRKASPRLGLVYRLTENKRFRAAYQRWFRPASLSTLSPIATAGIPLEDRLVTAGGEVERWRGQFEFEFANGRLFATAFYDYSQNHNFVIESQGSVNPPRSLQGLTALQQQRFVSQARADILEAVPEFNDARVQSGGAALNFVLADWLSLYQRVAITNSENRETSEAFRDAFRGKEIAFLPDRTVTIGATAVSPMRIQVSAQAVYRDKRFADEGNLFFIDPGWDIGLGAFWETANKRLFISAEVTDLLLDNATHAADPATSDPDDAEADTSPALRVNAALRF